jgi:hypothetical protein
MSAGGPTFDSTAVFFDNSVQTFDGGLIATGWCQTAAQAVASCNVALTNWATVTLAAPLYFGTGGALSGYLWTTPVPQAGQVLYYDPTYITIATDGSITSTSNNCSAVIQFNNGIAGWAIELFTITPGLASAGEAIASASGNLSGNAAQFATAAQAIASGAAAFATNITLQTAAQAVASGAATLTAAIEFANHAAALATAVNNLTTGIKLQTAANALASATGSLVTHIQLRTAAQAVASGSATLSAFGSSFETAAQAIAGGATPYRWNWADTRMTFDNPGYKFDGSVPYGFLTTQIELVTAAQAVATAANNLKTAIPLSVAAQAVASGSGSIATLKLLQVSAQAIASGSATLRTGPGFKTAAQAYASGTAALTTKIELQTSAQAIASGYPDLLTVEKLIVPVLLSHQVPGIYQPGEQPWGQFQLNPGEKSYFGIDWTYWISFRWQPGFTVAADHVVRAFPWTGFEYICTTAGQTGNYPPVWPIEVGQTVLDGSAVWTAQAVSSASLQTTVVSAAWFAPVGIVATGYLPEGNMTPVFIDTSAASPDTSYDVMVECTMASGDILIGQLVFGVY